MNKRIKCIVMVLFFSVILYANVITNISLQDNYKSYTENVTLLYSDEGLLKKYVNNNNENIVYDYQLKDFSENKICIERNDNDGKACYYEIFIEESFIEIVNENNKERFDYKIHDNEISIEGKQYHFDYSNSDFHLKTQNVDYYFNDSLLYDKKSYGKFFISKNVRNIFRVTNVLSNSIEITSFCPHDSSISNCFSYDKDDIYSYKIQEGSIPLLFRFINYYISMANNQYDIEIIISFFLSDFSISKNINKILSIEASSFLTEGSKKYWAENLLTLDGLPWASGNGYGINDYIMMYIESEGNLTLTFFNGFQSTEKPYLYSMNSRVKKMKITDIDTNKSMIVLLKDKKEKQIIDIKEIVDNSKRTVRLKIEPLEVYKGLKYSDLCIQAIIVE